ncbi:2-hydroxyacid dehydrogenase [Geotoga petraea]
MMKVSVTYKIPEKGIEFLKKNYDVWVNTEERNLSKEELKKVASESDAMITLLSDKIDEEVIEVGKGKLKIISNYAVGYNNIDVKSASKNGIVVTNTPDVLTETTADLAWALMMSAARRIVEADKFVREGNFVGWKPELLMGQDIFGKTLGVIGLGRIGLAVAKRAKGFNMKVLYNKRTPLSKEKEEEYGIRYAEIDEILENSDFVSLNVPLTPETDHLLNKENLDKMKSNSVLVNTSRGKVIDEAYLAEKLEKKEIAAAGLDVFEFEPEVNEKLLKLDNVVVAPHIGSATKETRDEMSMMVAKDIDAVLSGKEAKNVVKG